MAKNNADSPDFSAEVSYQAQAYPLDSERARRTRRSNHLPPSLSVPIHELGYWLSSIAMGQQLFAAKRHRHVLFEEIEPQVMPLVLPPTHMLFWPLVLVSYSTLGAGTIGLECSVLSEGEMGAADV
ncbi:hypothetical protein NUU61_001362 [Penicillium alfredii]|uniref:Uncharacterized protein n=1 Tax=Penicillium alfredii TaxID=1506179 RepID=A0A9W9G497_9EURO|nr:uncharacterized protein NUU61_001362 [Penicillium alfredii]KAJ5111732.1 hypothetical protein NUU61_001362 [Penicillium alfredii]